MTVADQASKGMGIRSDEAVLQFTKERVLIRHKSRSLCLDVSPEKVRVLPKQHASQRGITVRSLSHHLALQSAVNVQAEWIVPTGAAGDLQLDLLNLLLLPWPEDLPRERFRISEGSDGALDLPNRFRFFHMAASRECPDKFRRKLVAAVAAARQHVDRLHGIVFPELALSLEQYEIAEEIAIAEGVLLIAGVWLERGQRMGTFGASPTNVCVVQPTGLVSQRGVASAGTAPPPIASAGTEVLADKEPSTPATSALQGAASRLVRAKNHRWCLDGRQIRGYGLAGRIPASKDCWELTSLHPRSITFLTVGNWMTLCVQICEDLARQDDVASLIRSVGPNLVVALLLDGPQLSTRWPSRYASILADDPGTSVLTLTSLGMTALSSPPKDLAGRPRVIALWRDIENGEREIELAPDENACVIHLVCQSGEEFTADGRGDGGVAHFPVYQGHRGLSVKT